MAKRHNNDICLHCFGTLSKDRVCLSCGKKDEGEPSLSHHLQRRTLLHKRYLIVNAIGEGGFGITYKAWDIVSGRRVAIKEYYPSGYVCRDARSQRIIINSKQNHAPTNRGLKRFIDEAQNLSRITDHSGIVEVLDFFSENATAYIVMEFLDGISLKKYLKHKGKLTAHDALTILKPVIYSLREVHEAGLIHRDISPDNILITRTGEVKLIDFGAAKQNSSTSQDAGIVLKQGFAPEEQYRLSGEQGPWTDIYALGVTLYYSMTATLPQESIQRMYDDKIELPSALGVKIKKRTENALMKALAVFAKDRYRSIDALVSDLYAEDEAKDPPSSKRSTSKTTQSRNTTIKRKKTAEDLKNRLKEKGTKLSSKKKEEKKTEEKPSSRYKKVERKYGKDFAENLSQKVKKKR